MRETGELTGKLGEIFISRGISEMGRIWVLRGIDTGWTAFSQAIQNPIDKWKCLR
jgi:hypothetical protein